MVDLVLEMARDRTTEPQTIADWMVTTSTCICNATFGADDPMPLLLLYIKALEVQYPDTMKQIYEIFSNSNWANHVLSIPKGDGLSRLLWAAGSTFDNGEFKLIDDEINVSKEGLQRFKSIWKTPTRKINY